MNESGFSKFFWGFLFVLIDFRISGFDILPNVIGYIFFAVGFSILSENSEYFIKARNYNIPMIILSVFSIYQKPAQGSGIQLGPLGLFSIPIAISVLVLNILVVYNLFMGIKNMAHSREQMDIYTDADTMWKQFLVLQVVAIFALAFMFIPVVSLVLAYIFVLYILSIVITAQIMRFMKRCGEGLT